MSGRLRSVACSVRTPIAYRPYGASSGADGVTVSMRFDCASALPARATAANVENISRRNIVTSTVGTTEETEATGSTWSNGETENETENPTRDLLRSFLGYSVSPC